MQRFWHWLTHRVDDPPGDDCSFRGICGWVAIADPCAQLKVIDTIFHQVAPGEEEGT